MLLAALLTPQGKIVADCIVAEAPAQDGGGFFLDCPKALAQDFMRKLNFYKLRAKVIVEDLSETLGVMALWDDKPQVDKFRNTEYGLVYSDPRLPALGQREAQLRREDAAAAGAGVTGDTDFHGRILKPIQERSSTDYTDEHRLKKGQEPV